MTEREGSRLGVLQVHNRYLSPGGEDTVVNAERTVLRNAGHRVEVLEVENPAGLAAVPRLAMSPWNPLTARAAADAAAAGGVDVAHVHNLWFSLSPSVLRAISRQDVPVVATVHNYRMTCLNGQLFRDGEVCERCIGSHPVDGVRFGCYRDSVPQSAAIAVTVSAGRANDFWQRHIDRFVVMTEFSRRLLERIGVDPARVVVKPHFSDDVGERPDRPSQSSEVLFVGRLGPEKGVDVLIDAWKRAGTQETRLTIVGDGPMRSELTELAPDSVDFLGWVSPDEVHARMLGARALVFPSVWYETFGMVLTEAMSAGLPIVASEIAGVPDVIGRDHPEVLAPPSDPQALAEVITALDRGELDVDLIGRQNRLRYETSYTPSVGLTALENLYRSVIEGT